MYSALATPKWNRFQESLARILQVSMAIINSSGELYCIYNISNWYRKCNQNPLIKVAYQEFYLGIAQMNWQLEQERIVTDPLGVQVGVLKLSDGSFILLWGGLTNKNSTHVLNLNQDAGIIRMRISTDYG